MNSREIGQHYLKVAMATFQGQKRLAERALAQLEPEQFMHAPDESSNSVAIIMKHLAGNMHSRWENFFMTDGEKPTRDRDAEFEQDRGEVDELMLAWESGWTCLLETLEGMSAEDLLRTVTIRGEAHTVLQAIERQVSHYAYHVGQIVYLAKSLRGEKWHSLSIPKGESKRYLSAPPDVTQGGQ